MRKVPDVSNQTEQMKKSKPIGYFGKRALDVIVATLLLVTFSVPMILIALLILISMGRPVLFRQSRPGLNEVPFVMLKFRTMVNSAGTHDALLSDSQRITRLGAFLRATSLDELPELLNVIRGDMSLVGPRPLLLRYLPFYTEKERRRHAVRPGITGLAQISGRNSVPWDERLALDVSYVERASLLLDLRILGMTALRVLSRHGVQVIASEHALDLDVERRQSTDATHDL